MLVKLEGLLLEPEVLVTEHEARSLVDPLLVIL
jgi:hypothetical protein